MFGEGGGIERNSHGSKQGSTEKKRGKSGWVERKPKRGSGKKK